MLVHRRSSAQHVQCVKTPQLVHLRCVRFSLYYKKFGWVETKPALLYAAAVVAQARAWARGLDSHLESGTLARRYKNKKNFFEHLCRKVELYCNKCVSHPGPWLSVLKHQIFEQVNASRAMAARFHVVNKEQSRQYRSRSLAVLG